MLQRNFIVMLQRNYIVSRINVFYWNSHRRIAYRASTLHKALLKHCWQKFIKDKRAFKLNLSRQNNSKTSSWSTISYNLKEVESIAFQLTRSVCLKSQAGRFGRGEFAEFAKYFLTLDKRIIKINLLWCGKNVAIFYFIAFFFVCWWILSHGIRPCTFSRVLRPAYR